VDAAADWKAMGSAVRLQSWRDLSVAPSSQRTKQSEVAGEYVRRKRIATKMSGTLALNHGGTVT